MSGCRTVSKIDKFMVLEGLYSLFKAQLNVRIIAVLLQYGKIVDMPFLHAGI